MLTSFLALEIADQAACHNGKMLLASCVIKMQHYIWRNSPYICVRDTKHAAS
jgi:hypothetical protein